MRDKNAMEWAGAWMAHKEPPANKVGFMYMLRGDGGATNTDPYATKEEPGNNWIKTGAHVMIVGCGAKMVWTTIREWPRPIRQGLM